MTELTTLHSSDPAEEARLELLRQQRTELDGKMAVQAAVLKAARAVVKCIADKPTVTLAPHTCPTGCLRVLSNAVAALDRQEVGNAAHIMAQIAARADDHVDERGVPHDHWSKHLNKKEPLANPDSGQTRGSQ